jgi:hypothetical protein
MKKLIFVFAFLFSAAAVCQTPQYLPKSRVPWTDPQDYGATCKPRATLLLMQAA